MTMQTIVRCSVTLLFCLGVAACGGSGPAAGPTDIIVPTDHGSSADGRDWPTAAEADASAATDASGSETAADTMTGADTDAFRAADDRFAPPEDLIVADHRPGADTLPGETVPEEQTQPQPDQRPPDLPADLVAADQAATDTGGHDSAGDQSQPAAPEPFAPGPFGVETTSTEVERIDGSTIAVDLYLPTPAAGPAPTVVFSHGFQLSGSGYVEFGQLAASHGLVTVLPSYGDTLFSPRTHVELAEDVSVILSWLETENANPDSALFERVDTARMGAGGHSRGGKQSILAAIGDPRIRASFNFDPVDAGPPFGGNEQDYPSVAPEMMAQFAVPGGFVGSGYGGEAPLGQACAPTDDNYHQYFIAAPVPAYEYLLSNAGHLDFVDDCGLLCFTCTTGDDRDWNRAFANATAVAFYRVYLADDDRYRPWVDGAPVTALSERVVFASH